MKKIFLMGRSEAGKTSLTQALKGEELHYIKTQYTNSNDDTIDSPGEYAESKRFSVGLACFSFEADVVAIVQAADEPFNLFGASCRSFILRPLIGIITKIDSPYANIPMVKQWLINAGCERIFMVNNVTREGIDELMEYLQEDPPSLTLEQAKFKQSLGLNEWDPLPEGVTYPDVNKGKWIGVGGHFEEGESPEECMLREVFEETGYTLTSWKFRGIVTFSQEGYGTEYMCLYTADGFTGTMKECDEGKLKWIPKDEIWNLRLWEGDKIFLKLLNEDVPFFSLKLSYKGDELVETVLDGRPLESQSY